MKNYYDLLEINKNASEEVIKSAYRALAKKYHPDNNGMSNAEKLAEINEAYEVLSNPEKKREYDAQLKDDYVDTEKTYYQKAEYTPKQNSYEKYETDPEMDAVAKRFMKSKPIRFFRSVGREISHSHSENLKNVDNAYLMGLSMSEYELVKAFKKSSGAERGGYRKALVEKGLLKRDSQGNLVPTDMFKNLY